MSADVKAKLREAKRLSRIRIRADRGEELDPEERSILEAAGPAKRTRPRKLENLPPADRQLTAGDLPPSMRSEESPPAPPRQFRQRDEARAEGESNQPPPPPPPPIEVLPANHRKGEDWRAKWRVGPSGGREELCKQAAALYVGALGKLVDYIEKEGGKPLIDRHGLATMVFPAAVLTFDKLMPEIEVGPEVELAIGSGLIIGQAAVKAVTKSKRKEPKKSSNVDWTRQPTQPEPTPPVPAETVEESPHNGHEKPGVVPSKWDLTNRNVFR